MSDSNQRKPWYRPRNVSLAVLAALLLSFGWASLEVWKVYTADPHPTVDYRAKLREMAEQNAGISPEEADDSWRLFMEAMEGYKEAERQVGCYGRLPLCRFRACDADNSEIAGREAKL